MNYIYIYISNIQSASEDSECGLFLYTIYDKYHINLCECSMYGSCYITQPGLSFLLVALNKYIYIYIYDS